MNIKKITTSLLITGFIFTGCSNSQTSNVAPQTIQKSSINIQDSDITLRFKKANSLQNKKNFAEAIEVYNSIIRKYSHSEYKDLTKSAYINMFECSVLSDRTFRITDVNNFLEKFGRNKSFLMTFELLHILNQAKRRSVDEKVEKWASEYRGIKLRDWTFSYIDYWATHTKQPEIRSRLRRYIKIFKKFI